MAEYIFEIGEALYNEKTGEAVMKPTYKGKIVRCKDCKYYRKTNFFGFGVEATECKWWNKLTVDDTFCSYGERRSENDTIRYGKD